MKNEKKIGTRNYENPLYEGLRVDDLDDRQLVKAEFDLFN